MIQVGICDDEPVMLHTLESFTHNCFSQNQVFATIQTFSSSLNLIYEIQDGTHFDLLLLDIEMPEMNGMQLAAQVKQLLPQVLVIFITSHIEYALDAYELSIFRYIPKTNMDTRLTHALLDAAQFIQVQMSKSYIIQNQNRLERIPYKNLLYISHEGKNALLITNLNLLQASSFKVRKTLQQIYEELDTNEFIFIDRGCIVNLSHILSIKNNECILKDGTHLAVSQSRMQDLKEHMLLFWKEHI